MKHGAKWMYVDTTGNDYYPTNGVGGVGTTSTGNTTAGARWCKVYGVLVMTASGAGATTITVETDNGADGATAMTGLAIPIAQSQACPLYIPLGGEDGISIPGPVAAATSSSSTKFVLFYDKLM